MVQQFLDTSLPNVSIIQIQCQSVLSLVKIFDQIGGVEWRASWNLETSAIRFTLELPVLWGASKVRSKIGGEVYFRELDEILIDDIFKEELDVRDCQIIAGQIQSPQIDEES